MDIIQIYSRPLSQSGRGVYTGSKFQNGGLVVYSGSRVQNGGLIFDKLIPALKENIKKAARFLKPHAKKAAGKHLINKGTPALLSAAAKPISKVVGSDISPYMKLAEPAIRKRLLNQVGDAPVTKRRKTTKRKTTKRRKIGKNVFSN